jgi:hypothetical protein
MRRVRAEATHPSPFLEDLYAVGKRQAAALGDIDLVGIGRRTPAQDAMLRALWSEFSALTARETATCVGITKAVLLMTNGRIGPAFDSVVRGRLGLKSFGTPEEWLLILEACADDIAAFESRHGPFVDAVPNRFRHLGVGRLYDMALGPR